MLVKAFFVAFEAHRGQKDKAGKAYILHPLNVALRVKGKKEKEAALLHDVIEDTDLSIIDLLKMGFDDEVIMAVLALTKIRGETYHEYLDRVKRNNIATKVKIADLTHNSNLKRLKIVTEKDVARAKKYKSAIKYLSA